MAIKGEVGSDAQTLCFQKCFHENPLKNRTRVGRLEFESFWLPLLHVLPCPGPLLCEVANLAQGRTTLSVKSMVPPLATAEPWRQLCIRDKHLFVPTADPTAWSSLSPALLPICTLPDMSLPICHPFLSCHKQVPIRDISWLEPTPPRTVNLVCCLQSRLPLSPNLPWGKSMFERPLPNPKHTTDNPIN